MIPDPDEQRLAEIQHRLSRVLHELGSQSLQSSRDGDGIIIPIKIADQTALMYGGHLVCETIRQPWKAFFIHSVEDIVWLRTELQKLIHAKRAGLLPGAISGLEVNQCPRCCRTQSPQVSMHFHCDYCHFFCERCPKCFHSELETVGAPPGQGRCKHCQYDYCGEQSESQKA